MKFTLAILFLSLLTVAFAQETASAKLPDTPAGRMVEAWLKARNTGKVADIQAFHAKHDARQIRDDFSDPEVQGKVKALHELFGEVAVNRISESKPLELHALLKSSKGKWLSLWFQVEEGTPDKLVGMRIELTDAPADAKDK